MKPAGTPPSARPISRRDALLTALAWGPLACQRAQRSSQASASAPMSSGSSASWGGLQVATAGPMREGERGGVAVVLLHGLGASGDDLVPLGERLARPGSRFYMPAAPLSHRRGGRAWWQRDEDRPRPALDDQLSPGHRLHPELQAARSAVQALLRTISERQAPSALLLAGFSQGAMLALDVALAAAPGVQRVAALSGALLVDSLPALRATAGAARRPAVFLAHGRQDPVVPFTSGDRARQLLQDHGYQITWCPFSGGHEIPRPVVSELGAFLFFAER